MNFERRPPEDVSLFVLAGLGGTGAGLDFRAGAAAALGGAGFAATGADSSAAGLGAGKEGARVDPAGRGDAMAVSGVASARGAGLDCWTR